MNEYERGFEDGVLITHHIYKSVLWRAMTVVKAREEICREIDFLTGAITEARIREIKENLGIL